MKQKNEKENPSSKKFPCGILCGHCDSHLIFYMRPRKYKDNRENIFYSNYVCPKCGIISERDVFIKTLFTFICPKCSKTISFYSEHSPDKLLANFTIPCRECKSIIQWQPTIIGKVHNLGKNPKYEYNSKKK